MSAKTVTFKSAGQTCAADLYLPDGFRSHQPHAALVIGHGFGISKKSLIEEGKFFSNAGYPTLAIDYRSFGESEGQPRGQLFPLNEVEDFRNAISYLERQPGMDPKRIGIWGTSFGGGIVTYTAAVDRRVRAVVAQVPVMDGYKWMRFVRSAGDWEDLLDRLDEDRRQRYETGHGARIAIAVPGGFRALPVGERTLAAMRQAIEETGGPLLDGAGEIEMESIERVMEFSPMNVIERIGPRPICIVTTARYDVTHPLENIYEAYKRAQEPKKIVLLPVEQLDVYKEPGRSMALKEAVKWFDEYLKQE
jgi:uncharacterized protein